VVPDRGPEGMKNSKDVSPPHQWSRWSKLDLQLAGAKASEEGLEEKEMEWE